MTNGPRFPCGWEGSQDVAVSVLKPGDPVRSGWREQPTGYPLWPRTTGLQEMPALLLEIIFIISKNTYFFLIK